LGKKMCIHRTDKAETPVWAEESFVQV